MLNGEKDKLPDLPSTRSKFWDKADTKVIKVDEFKPCKHYFVRASGREIFCRKCNIGFYADQNTEVKEGKIFYREKKVL